MNKIAAVTLALVPAVFLAVTNGCSPSTELGGVEVLNALPETRITGAPPVLVQTDIVVDFFWTGSDPDGNVRGYQWKMTSNGEDGISVMDTLTVDPATGDTLNPWHYTTATDTTFIVTADSSGFSGDSSFPEYLQRFSQPHTLFIRSVDDDDGVDPSPAMITFTATTLAPTIKLSTPEALTAGYRDAKGVPPTFVFGWVGNDPDFETSNPTKVRYLLKRALLESPGAAPIEINTQYSFNLNKDALISFSEPGWSDWIPYAVESADRRSVFARAAVQPGEAEKYYFFALQAQDTAGAVSLDLTYARTVHNFRIDASKTPALTIREEFLGEAKNITGTDTNIRVDIAQNQPLEFTWFADANDYGGIIDSYRYGWDIDDVTNDDDPGWAIQWGLSNAHKESPLKTFDSGIHTLTVETRDNSGQFSRVRYVLTVVPVPSPADQLPLLLIDDVPDQNNNGWPDEVGIARGADRFRDDFWSNTLSVVSGWGDDVDEIDTEENVTWSYREVVNYKLLLWTTVQNVNSYITKNFVPTQSASSVFVWLETYMSNVGNVFMIGSSAMRNFHPDRAGLLWLSPIIYDNDESGVLCNSYLLSFGTREEDDGTFSVVGREQFPYRVMGLGMTNMMVPDNFYIGPTVCGHGKFDVANRCGGTKAVILDTGFKNQYAPNVTFADTVFTWDLIDFDDDGIVSENYDFGNNDEFYDVNVTARTTNWAPQQLPDGTPTVVPMWRAYTRYDWIADTNLAAGNSDFPGDLDVAASCGSWAIDPNTGRMRTDGVPVGVMSFKTSDTKPGGRPDMLWGFDPYRFEPEEMTKAVRWTLQDRFGVVFE
jgi:hypothetical protein